MIIHLDRSYILSNPKLVVITFPMELVHNCQLNIFIETLIDLPPETPPQVLVELSSNLV